MKKLLILFIIISSLLSCQKKGNDPIPDEYFTYEIRVTPKNKFASYYFFESNEKTRKVVNNYTTFQTYKKDFYVGTAVMFTTDQYAKTEIFKNGILFASDSGIKSILLNFIAK